MMITSLWNTTHCHLTPTAWPQYLEIHPAAAQAQTQANLARSTIGTQNLSNMASGSGALIGGINQGVNNWGSSNLGGGLLNYYGSSAISGAGSLLGDTGAGTTSNSFGQAVNNEFVQGI